MSKSKWEYQRKYQENNPNTTLGRERSIALDMSGISCLGSHHDHRCQHHTARSHWLTPNPLCYTYLLGMIHHIDQVQ